MSVTRTALSLGAGPEEPLRALGRREVKGVDAAVISAQLDQARADTVAQIEVVIASARDVDAAIIALRTTMDRAQSAARELQERLDRATRLAGAAPLELGVDREIADALDVSGVLPLFERRTAEKLNPLRARLGEPEPERS